MRAERLPSPQQGTLAERPPRSRAPRSPGYPHTVPGTLTPGWWALQGQPGSLLAAAPGVTTGNARGPLCHPSVPKALKEGGWHRHKDPESIVRRWWFQATPDQSQAAPRGTPGPQCSQPAPPRLQPRCHSSSMMRGAGISHPPQHFGSSWGQNSRQRVGEAQQPGMLRDALGWAPLRAPHTDGHRARGCVGFRCQAALWLICTKEHENRVTGLRTCHGTLQSSCLLPAQL